MKIIPKTSDLYTGASSDHSLFRKVFRFTGDSLFFDVVSPSSYPIEYSGTSGLVEDVFKCVLKATSNPTVPDYEFTPRQGMRLVLEHAVYELVITMRSDSTFAYAQSGAVGALPLNAGTVAAFQCSANTPDGGVFRNYDIGHGIKTISTSINAALIAAKLGLGTIPGVNIPHDAGMVYFFNDSDAVIELCNVTFDGTSKIWVKGATLVDLAVGATYPLPIAGNYVGVDSAMTAGNLVVTYIPRA